MANLGPIQIPTLLNGWHNFDTDWSFCGYHKDASGVVHLQGLVAGGPIGQDQVISQLPPGFRPAARALFPVISSSSGISIAPGRVDITADGKVIALVGGNLYFCLDGISFSSYIATNDNVSLPYYGSVDYIHLLDVWGEGRIIADGMTTGFPQAYNLNKDSQKISNGPNTGQSIPNLVGVNDYENPVFPLADGSVEHITLMGAPITNGTAREMYRVLDKGRGLVILYDPDATSKYNFESNKGDLVAKSDSLNSPFNEISNPGPVYVYGFPNVINHDEL